MVAVKVKMISNVLVEELYKLAAYGRVEEWQTLEI